VTENVSGCTGADDDGFRRWDALDCSSTLKSQSISSSTRWRAGTS